MSHVYINLGRLISEEENDLGLLKIVLNTSGMSFKEKVKFNFQIDTWAYRFEYIGKYIKNKFGLYKK